jgi:hypothetical protein
MDDSSLGPQETSTINIDIPGVTSDISGQIKLRSSDGLELAVPVAISVIEPGQQCGASANALSIDKESLIWSQECRTGEEIKHDAKISNTGGSVLSNLAYRVDDSGAGGLEDLENGGYIIVPLTDVSIGLGESKTIEVKITPSYAGKYEGAMKFTSGTNEATMFVSLNCFEDITSELSSMEGNVSSLSVSEDIKDGITSDITSAKNAISLGNYAQAESYYQSAKAKVSLIQAGGASKPIDMTMPIMIIVAVIIVVILLWLFKFRKPKVSAIDEETEGLEGFQ